MNQNNNNQGNPYYNNSQNNNTDMMQNKKNMQGMKQMQNNSIGQNPYLQQQNSGFSTSEILTGVLVGAAATYILTNETVQKTIFKGVVSLGDILAGGIDEMKERFEDAKAEHEAEKEA